MSYSNAMEVLHAWMGGVNGGQIDDVLGLYADGAVLLPTFSPHAITTEEMRRRYFEQLGARPGLNVSLHQRTVREQPLAGSLRVISGIYCFRMEIDGELLGFEARFSYVVDPGASRPILHHHSSQIPRNLS
ncbi:MAG: DUF4440 domain-containing protein [Verrucomicrobiae bacterium]|nr:DUF4440 domain-containing protein [Verrucomicrobiae bacterium]